MIKYSRSLRKCFQSCVRNKFRPCMTNTFRISTFHCICHNISLLNYDLLEIFAVKLQNISDLSGNVFNAVYVTNFGPSMTNTLQISTFHCNCHNICQLNYDLPEIFKVKLQNISDLSGNVFNRVYVTNSDLV